MVSPLIAGALTFTVSKKLTTQRAWGAFVALQMMMVAGGFIALQTGETEEDVVEKVVAEAAIEQHEDIAKIFFWGSVFVMLGGLAPIVLKDEKFRFGAMVGVTAGSTIVLFMGMATGVQGGKLVYHHGAASAYTNSAAAQASAMAMGGQEDDD